MTLTTDLLSQPMPKPGPRHRRGETCEFCAQMSVRLEAAAVIREEMPDLLAAEAPWNRTAYLLDPAKCGTDPVFLNTTSSN